MARVVEYRNGVPNWADVAVADTDACASFYAGLFGWEADDQGPESGHYHLFRSDGAAAAGLGPKSGDDGMPIWSAYVAVDDLDDALARVPGAGGTVVMPRTEVGASGAMAVVTDPSGARVSLWQAGDHIGAEVVNVPGALAWHELTTRDAAAAMDFFASVLGWTYEPMPAEPDGEPGIDPGVDSAGESIGYQMVSVGERVVAGVMPMEGDDWGDLPSHWMVYFAVSDTDAAADRVNELGGAVSVPPFDVPVGRIAVCNDPEGNAFSIITFAGPVDEIEGGIA